jgi:hypothetical protein
MENQVNQAALSRVLRRYWLKNGAKLTIDLGCFCPSERALKCHMSREKTDRKKRYNH